MFLQKHKSACVWMKTNSGYFSLTTRTENLYFESLHSPVVHLQQHELLSFMSRFFNLALKNRNLVSVFYLNTPRTKKLSVFLRLVKLSHSLINLKKYCSESNAAGTTFISLVSEKPQQHG